ncbi:MAG: glycosyltransferase family 2 protein [Acidobacteriota bacterium]
MPDHTHLPRLAHVTTPAFSIVMPLWNKEATVGRAIESVLAQTVQDWELIIVNDGSTDESAAAASRFQDPRIRMVHQENQGVSAARNRGVAEAKADWVAFLDADDEWLPDFLETVAGLRRKFPEAALCGTGYFYKRTSGAPRQAPVRGMRGRAWEGLLEDYFRLASASAPPLWSSAVAARKAALEAIGGFPAGVTAGEDLLTWARLAARFPVAYSSEPRAVFWYPASPAERPGRVPDPLDAVGEGLRALYAAAPPVQKASLAQYIAHWHDMRSVIYLGLGDRAAARAEGAKASAWGGWTTKRCALYLLALLPVGSWALYRGLKALWRARTT